MNLDLATTVAGLLPVISLLLAAAGGLLLIAALVALARARLWRFAWRGITGTVLLVVGLGFVGLHGYSRLTHEALVATISVRPTGAQRFEADFRFADGRTASYGLAGDELYVDARILKWKPSANLLGIHTLWSLERVAGRYRDLAQERSATRTVHPLSAAPMIDFFELRQRHAWLSPLYDAEYGSASFVPVTGPAELELRVTTSGLIIRPAGPGASS
jgi:hypothetical protein